MENLREDRECYVLPAQREVLLDLITNPIIETSFFLTGGTALSIFYLHHRLSNDLDFFTLNPLDLSEIDFWIKGIWRHECSKIKEGPHFLSFVIKETKVDFVIDPLSLKEERHRVIFENGHHLLVDSIDNIVSNKFCAILSRVEPKDYIDFYYIQKRFPKYRLEDIFEMAKTKDAIFDDPPTAAFQIEEGLSFIKENIEIIPKLRLSLNKQDFFDFYNNIASWLYKKIEPNL